MPNTSKRLNLNTRNGTPMASFTHLDEKGRVRMVDVTGKPSTARMAKAAATVHMSQSTFDLIQQQRVKKGNVLETARIAGVMAAKRTSELIPMCHPLRITHVQVDFLPDVEKKCIGIQATVRTIDATGVEMEALTAVSMAGLTVYDMCKSYDKEMSLSDIRLLEKTGGKSGTFKRGRT